MFRRWSHRWRGSALAAVVAAVAGVPGVAAASANGGAPVGGGSSAVPAAVVSSTGGQAIAGFGASGTWWPADLAHFPQQAQNKLANLLFTSSGIQLSQYRFMVGSGGLGVTTPTAGESELGAKMRSSQTFLVRPGVYDWQREPDQVSFLVKAATDHVPGLTAIAYSAPAVWTSNGKTCGGTLPAANVAAYARYLAHVVAHLRNVNHIPIDSVSPMNEPADSQATCTQSGMAVPVARRGALVRDLGTDLAAQVPGAQVSADETSTVANFIATTPQWLSEPGTAAALGVLTTHAYDFPSDAVLSHGAAVAAAYGKPDWMTEICCYNTTTGAYGAQYDPTITSGLWLANGIGDDIQYLHASAFDWWLAASPALGCDPADDPTCATTVNSTGYNDGLLYYDPNYTTDHDYNLYPTKRFYVMGNYSRFIRPGDVYHQVTGAPANLRMLAFKSPRGWTVIVVNNSPAGSPATTLHLSFPGGGGGVQAAAAYLTSATDNLTAVIPGSTTRSGMATETVPAQSITSYLFRSTSGTASSHNMTSPTPPAGSGQRARRPRTAIPRVGLPSPDRRKPSSPPSSPPPVRSSPSQQPTGTSVPARRSPG